MSIQSPLSAGIPYGDLLIKNAIKAGLDDLKKNPFILDYLFLWPVNDPLTYSEYGEVERTRGKQWFLNTELNVMMDYHVDDPKFPLISVSLQSSLEDTATLADINYDTEDTVEASEITVTPNIVLGPFTPSTYDPTTGIVALPNTLNTDNVFKNMVYVDPTNNKGYIIREVLNSLQFQIDSGISANFSNSYVAPIDAFYVTSLESVQFRQTYSIKCFAQGEIVNLLYLHSILEFVLLRYREVLLEARGFERSSISSGPMYQFQDPGVEMTFGRDVTLTGFVRATWPKAITAKLNGIQVQGIQILSNATTPISFNNSNGWGTIIQS
jgi:hypothetical protein